MECNPRSNYCIYNEVNQFSLVGRLFWKDAIASNDVYMEMILHPTRWPDFDRNLSTCGRATMTNGLFYLATWK